MNDGDTARGQSPGGGGAADALLGFRGLNVYKVAYRLSMEIFHISKGFPREERYSLTDQIRRSSRSVPAHIAEGYRKKRYRAVFVSKMVDADGDATK